MKCRYQNQEHSVEVALGLGPIDTKMVADLIDRFHAVYEREYTYRLDAPVEIVGLHLVASAEVGKLRPRARAADRRAARGRAMKGRRWSTMRSRARIRRTSITPKRSSLA